MTSTCMIDGVGTSGSIRATEPHRAAVLPAAAQGRPDAPHPMPNTRRFPQHTGGTLPPMPAAPAERVFSVSRSLHHRLYDRNVCLASVLRIGDRGKGSAAHVGHGYGTTLQSVAGIFDRERTGGGRRCAAPGSRKEGVVVV